MTSAKRVPSLPNVPTLQEQGLKNFEVVVWHGLYAPKGTPKPVLDKLNAALRAAVQDAAFKDALAKLGSTPAPLDKVTPDGAIGSTSKRRSTAGARSSRKPGFTPTS